MSEEEERLLYEEFRRWYRELDRVQYRKEVEKEWPAAYLRLARYMKERREGKHSSFVGASPTTGET